jgi:hypothetical protein
MPPTTWPGAACRPRWCRWQYSQARDAPNHMAWGGLQAHLATEATDEASVPCSDASPNTRSACFPAKLAAVKGWPSWLVISRAPMCGGLVSAAFRGASAQRRRGAAQGLVTGWGSSWMGQNPLRRTHWNLPARMVRTTRGALQLMLCWRQRPAASRRGAGRHTCPFRVRRAEFHRSRRRLRFPEILRGARSTGFGIQGSAAPPPPAQPRRRRRLRTPGGRQGIPA